MLDAMHGMGLMSPKPSPALLTPREKRNWFEATELLRTEQERTITERKNKAAQTYEQ